jgi:ketosteroid isomerase-like protein
MSQDSDRLVRLLITDHVDAFNAHDRQRLLAGLASDVVWTTGEDTFHGVSSLADVFDDGLWAMQPALTLTDLLVQRNRAAAQMLEVLTVDGRQRQFMIACFYEIRSGHIQSVKIYREGSADID